MSSSVDARASSQRVRILRTVAAALDESVPAGSRTSAAYSATGPCAADLIM